MLGRFDGGTLVPYFAVLAMFSLYGGNAVAGSQPACGASSPGPGWSRRPSGDHLFFDGRMQMVAWIRS